MSNRVKEIVSLTSTLGWKNEKQPSGPTELDLEAGNLVSFIYQVVQLLCDCLPTSDSAMFSTLLFNSNSF